MSIQRNGGPRAALPPETPASPPAPPLRVKRVVRRSPEELDFIAGVAAIRGGIFFRVDGSAHVQAETVGEACTLLLSEAAWRELLRQAELPSVEEFGTANRDFVYELPLRHVHLVYMGAMQIVSVTQGEVLSALKHFPSG